jgi:hypothetical protein
MLIHKRFLKAQQEKNPPFLPPIERPIRASFR